MQWCLQYYVILYRVITALYCRYFLRYTVYDTPTNDVVITWERFPHYWPFGMGIHHSSVDSPPKWPVTHTIDVSLKTWARCWTNSPVAGGLRRFTLMWHHCYFSQNNAVNTTERLATLRRLMADTSETGQAKAISAFYLPMDDSHQVRDNNSILNTLRPRQNGSQFPDDIFKSIFFNENVWTAIKISLKFVPNGPINIIPALVRIMAWRRTGDEPLSEPKMAPGTDAYTALGLNEFNSYWNKRTSISTPLSNTY